MPERDWAAESLALLRRERRRMERLLAGERPGDDGLHDAMEQFADEYDAWKREQRTTGDDGAQGGPR